MDTGGHAYIKLKKIYKTMENIRKYLYNKDKV